MPLGLGCVLPLSPQLWILQDPYNTGPRFHLSRLISPVFLLPFGADGFQQLCMTKLLDENNSLLTVLTWPPLWANQHLCFPRVGKDGAT